MQNKLTMLWKLIFVLALFTFFSSGLYAQLPFAPNLISPGNRDSCVMLNHRFIWQEEVFSSEYELQISRNSNFTSLVNSIITPNTFTDVVLPDFHYTYFWRVIVKYDNRNNNRIDTSEIWRFKTVFPSPTILLPADGATCLESNLQIKWTLPDSTSKYRVQISENPNFSTFAKDTVVVGYDFINWKAPKNNIMYYWRIRTEMHPGCASDWSPIYSFKTTQKAPTLLSPVNNAIGREQSIKLIWTYDINEENYMVRYSKSPNFTGETVNLITNLADTSYVINQLELNTTYYWQVAAMVDGCKSDWSEIFNFTTKYPITTLLYPISNDGCISMTPEFRWNAVPTARGYTIEVSTDNNFLDIVAQANDVKDTTVVLTLPKGITKYFWKIKAADAKNYGDWTNAETFNTTFEAPSPIYPLNATNDLNKNITFQWAMPYREVEYKFELAKVIDSLGFTLYEIVHRDTLAAGELAYVLPQYNTKYAWRVGTIDANNCNGMWSEYAVFTTKLGAPTLISPENKAVKVSISPDMKWELVDGGEYYEIEVATDSTFARGKVSHSMSYIHGNVIHFSQDYKYNTKHFWRVRAGKGQSFSEWSEVFSFTTIYQPAEKPIIIAPANLSTGQATAPEFVWKKSARAENYRIILALDNTFKTVLIDSSFAAPVEDGDLDITFNSNVILNNYTNYYWKVSAINVENDVVWSDDHTFRTIAKQLQIAPKLISPSNDSTNLELQVKFVWETVPTAILYHIQISTSKDFETDKIVIEDKNVNWNVRMLQMKDFGTDYYWRVRAINEVGEGPWSNIFKFHTYGKSSVEENEIVRFNLYPNPVLNNLSLKYISDYNQNANIAISDATGKIVLNQNVALSASSNEIKLNISSLQAGNYFLTISTSKSGNNTIKFTVIK